MTRWCVMTEPFLQVRNVTKDFRVAGRTIRAVDDISLTVNKGQCLAIVGESGSGKSTVANMILGLFPPTKGTIELGGEVLPPKRMLAHRQRIQLVQQNPLSALNPRRTIGASLRLALDVHNRGAKNERREIIRHLLEEVGLDQDLANRSAAALSGGQRQRVAIARALACQSDLIVLDEPTSALDVLVQARVLRLLADLRTARNLTYVFITHDLSVVRNIADHVSVFRSGKLVEEAPTEALFSNPQHSYTRNLIGAVPVVTQAEMEARDLLKEGGADA